MNIKPKTLVVIPARAGSKGLPRKNIIDLGGVPLLAWSIQVAKEAPSVTEVVVSTDDEEIADVAREWGATVPFLRPAELAGDRSLVSDAINYTISNLNQNFDIIVTLFPTHPFRTPALIEEAIEVVQTTSLGATSATSETNHPGDFLLFEGDRGRIALGQPELPILRQHAVITVSPRFPASVYKTRGREHYTALASEIRNGDERFLTLTNHLCVDDPILHTDIDTPEDLTRARRLLEENKVYWTPRNGYTSEVSSFVPREFTFRPPVYQCMAMSDSSKQEIQFEKNPIAMSPRSIRQELDNHKELKGEEVLIAIGNASLSKEICPESLGFDVNEAPSIRAKKGVPLHLGSGSARNTLGFGYQFVDKELLETVGDYVGDVPSKTVSGVVELDLAAFARCGASFFTRAYDANLQMLDVSPLYVYDGKSWLSKKTHRSAFAWNSDLGQLRVPEGTMAIDTHVFGDHQGTPKRGFSWAPLEFPGILEFDPLRSLFINRLLEVEIARRQDMPPIHRWDGYVFVPKSVPDDTPWNIHWCADGEAVKKVS